MAGTSDNIPNILIYTDTTPSCDVSCYGQSKHISSTRIFLLRMCTNMYHITQADDDDDQSPMECPVCQYHREYFFVFCAFIHWQTIYKYHWLFKSFVKIHGNIAQSDVHNTVNWVICRQMILVISLQNLFRWKVIRRNGAFNEDFVGFPLCWQILHHEKETLLTSEQIIRSNDIALHDMDRW